MVSASTSRRAGRLALISLGALGLLSGHALAGDICAPLWRELLDVQRHGDFKAQQISSVYHRLSARKCLTDESGRIDHWNEQDELDVTPTKVPRSQPHSRNPNHSRELGTDN